MDWNNKEEVLEVVKKDGSALEFASPRLQDDEEVVLAAVKTNKFALCFASPRLQDNREVLLAAEEKQYTTDFEYMEKLAFSKIQYAKIMNSYIQNRAKDVLNGRSQTLEDLEFAQEAIDREFCDAKRILYEVRKNLLGQEQEEPDESEPGE